MKKIRLLMIPINKSRIEFFIVDKLLKGKTIPTCDFYLKRFDILEIQNSLYSIKDYGLKENDSSFSLDLEISKSEDEASIYIINDEKDDELMKLRELTISTGSTRDGYSKISNVILLSKKISKIKISNIEIEKLEIIDYEGTPSVNINYVSINELDIKFGGSLEIKNSNLKEMKIFGVEETHKVSLHMSSSVLDTILGNNSFIDNFICYKTTIKWGKFLDTRINTLLIEGSDFGEINLINMELIQPAIIIKSFIEKMRIFNMKWHDKLLDDNEIKPLDLKDAYRQLKYIYENSHNYTEANKFFAKEMEYYEKLLSWRTEYDKKMIAFPQRLISNYGNSWIRAFSFYLLFCTSVYFLHDFFLEHSGNIDSHIQSIVNFWKGNWRTIFLSSESKELTRFLNPLPKVEDITNPLHLLFSLIKILIVYQIVVALRRISQR